MHKYKLLSRKGEGTFSEVLKAQSIATGSYVAIKCMKTHFNSVEQVKKLREIQALRKLSPHPNIVKLLEILYDEPTGRLALVFELMEMNMYELIKDKKNPLPPNKVKQYMYQVFRAIHHMHKNGIFHRDIKPENILIKGDLIKLADFGSCRGIKSDQPYTEYISTRWYRPPECLMTDGYYDYKMDIWGAACVMFEIITYVPLFPGSNEMDMIHRIHNVFGTPKKDVIDRFKRHASHMEFDFPTKAGSGIEKLMTNTSKDCIDLLKQMLIYDPEDRIDTDKILMHEYFREFTSLDVDNSIEHPLPVNNDGFLSPKPKTLKKPKKPNQFTDKSKGYTTNLPPLKLNLKVEGIFKSQMDTSTEEDERNGMTKHDSSIIRLDLHLGSHSTKKKEDTQKKYYSSLIKPNLANQNLLMKKSHHMYQNPDYVLYGKKAT